MIKIGRQQVLYDAMCLHDLRQCSRGHSSRLLHVCSWATTSCGTQVRKKGQEWHKFRLTNWRTPKCPFLYGEMLIRHFNLFGSHTTLTVACSPNTSTSTTVKHLQRPCLWRMAPKTPTMLLCFWNNTWKNHIIILYQSLSQGFLGPVISVAASRAKLYWLWGGDAIKCYDVISFTISFFLAVHSSVKFDS